jgi:hypothetical protein
MPPNEGEQAQLKPGDRCLFQVPRHCAHARALPSAAPLPCDNARPPAQNLEHASCAKLNGNTGMVLGHVDLGYGDDRVRWIVRWDGTEHLFRVQRRHLLRMHPDTSIAPDPLPPSRRVPSPPQRRAFTWGARPGKLEGVEDSRIPAGCYFANELTRSVPVW